MKSFKEWLKFNEMPMSISKIGDWQNLDASGFDKKSQGILSSEKGINKIIRRYKNVPYDFNVMLVSGEPNQMPSEIEINKLPDEWKKYVVPGKINIFFTHWDQDPVTPWMIAHRFAHTFKGLVSGLNFRSGLPELTQELDKIGFTLVSEPSFWIYHLTMKSARNRNINTAKYTNSDEAYHEMMAQYILEGSIKLKKLDLNNPTDVDLFTSLFRKRDRSDYNPQEEPQLINLYNHYHPIIKQNINNIAMEYMNEAKNSNYAYVF